MSKMKRQLTVKSKVKRQLQVKSEKMKRHLQVKKSFSINETVKLTESLCVLNVIRKHSSLLEALHGENLLHH